MGKIRIAIDGPSGAGKSTIAKRVAAARGFDYIDTGAMYRAVGYKMMLGQVDIAEDERVAELLAHTDIDFSQGSIVLDGTIIDDKIRTEEVAGMASRCSALPAVREKLVALQRKMGEEKSIVMDGRDIGTNVLKDAEYKFFMTASVEERAHRRWLELTEKGEDITLAEVKQDIARRDENDMTRALNPLRKAEDAVEVDTTGLSATQVTDKILQSLPQE